MGVALAFDRAGQEKRFVNTILLHLCSKCEVNSIFSC